MSFGTRSPVALCAGEVYRFPLNETPLTDIHALGFVWRRDSRDGECRSFVERGVKRLKLSMGMKSLMSFCAVVGFSLVWGIASHFGPFM